MNSIKKSGLLSAMLGAICLCVQSCGNGGANDVSKQPSAVTNGPARIQPLWLTDETNVPVPMDDGEWHGVLRISNRRLIWGQRVPVCQFVAENTSTNLLTCWKGLYGPTYSRIELLDSTGEPVSRTVEGQQIGIRTSDAQIKEMVKNRFRSRVRGRARTDGFIPIRLGQTCPLGFSIPNLFEIEQSGEYTLKLQTCVIQRVGGEKFDPDLKISWFPEVTVQFEIHSGVGQPSKQSANGQTNSPPN